MGLEKAGHEIVHQIAIGDDAHFENEVERHRDISRVSHGIEHSRVTQVEWFVVLEHAGKTNEGRTRINDKWAAHECQIVECNRIGRV
jgi:hypothetical protein